MRIGLTGDANKIPMAGKTVWITPTGSQGNKALGIGVRFGEDEGGVAGAQQDRRAAGPSPEDQPSDPHDVRKKIK